VSACALAAAPGLAAEPPAAEADAEDQSNAIVVTAAGYEQKITEAPASITVLDRAELQEKRFGSLAEALQDVQGIDVGGEAGKTGGLNISIRGMPSDYTLVLIDGRRQNAPGGVTPNGFGETSTSFLPPFSAIDRIEVVRGPMSTLYGSDAMGGVVNIITRKVGQRWVGTASAESTIQGDDRFGNIQSVNGFAQRADCPRSPGSDGAWQRVPPGGIEHRHPRRSGADTRAKPGGIGHLHLWRPAHADAACRP